MSSAPGFQRIVLMISSGFGHLHGQDRDSSRPRSSHRKRVTISGFENPEDLVRTQPEGQAEASHSRVPYFVAQVS